MWRSFVLGFAGLFLASPTFAFVAANMIRLQHGLPQVEPDPAFGWLLVLFFSTGMTALVGGFLRIAEPSQR